MRHFYCKYFYDCSATLTFELVLMR